MTAFKELPVLYQNIICFWALIVCLICIIGGMLMWRQKRPGFLFSAVADFLCGYFTMHVCRELTSWRQSGSIIPVADVLSGAPAAVFVLALAIFTAFGLFLCSNAMDWRKKHVSAYTIKESIDWLPAGVCCYRESGRCVLSNHRMNDVCYALTGCDLQNGETLYEAAKKAPVRLLPDGTAVSFRRRSFTYRREPLYELIADDVTELYRKGESLRQGNERAMELGESMKAYGETIADTVRRQEILDAKINIHDEMNRMLLATQKAVHSADKKERAEILGMWRSQTILMRRAPDRSAGDSVVSDLNALASVIGIEVVWNGAPGAGDTETLRLFLLAAREAVANAAKHAKAEKIYITVENGDRCLKAVFTNDGESPGKPIKETGGLGNLRRRIEKSGGRMEIAFEPEFVLTVFIPKGGAANALRSADS